MYESITMNVMELELCYLMSRHADKCNSSANQLQYKAKSTTFHASGNFQKQFGSVGRTITFLDKNILAVGQAPYRMSKQLCWGALPVSNYIDTTVYIVMVPRYYLSN